MPLSTLHSWRVRGAMELPMEAQKPEEENFAGTTRPETPVQRANTAGDAAAPDALDAPDSPARARVLSGSVGSQTYGFLGTNGINESQNKSDRPSLARRAATRDLGTRLIHDARQILEASSDDKNRIISLGLQLLKCEWRDSCGLTLCPCCAGSIAKKNRLSLQTLLRDLPSSAFAHITVTVASEDLAIGLNTLSSAMRNLRRRIAWTRSIRGGEYQIELKPADTAGAAFNVHAHMLVELKRGKFIRRMKRLETLWKKILREQSDSSGSFHADWVETLWDARDPDFSPLAFYVTKRRRTELAEMDPFSRAKLVLFMSGRRLSSRFGSWSGTKNRYATPGGTQNGGAPAEAVQCPPPPLSSGKRASPLELPRCGVAAETRQ